MDFFSKDKIFKKYHKLRYNITNRFVQLLYGNIGLLVQSFNKISKEILKTCLKFLKKILKLLNKKAKFFLKIFPDFHVTKKPKDIRMGRGKGLCMFKTCIVKAGTIILEVKNVSIKNSTKILYYCIKKIPGSCCIIYKNDIQNINLSTKW